MIARKSGGLAMNDEINNSNDCREKPKAGAELIRQMGQQVVEKISDKDYRSVWRPCRPLGEKDVTTRTAQ